MAARVGGERPAAQGNSQKELEELTLLIQSDYARRCFRDMGDQDYISARMAHRSRLPGPFLWGSLQAIEKYLKAILLFNGISTKKLSHRVADALDRVESEVVDIGFNVPSSVRRFIEYLQEYNGDRYLVKPLAIRLGSLQALDMSVWHVRRYCRFVRFSQIMRDQGAGLLDRYRKGMNDQRRLDRPQDYWISGGFLEGVLKAPDSLSYRHLIWRNFWYGRRRKLQLRDYEDYSMSTTPMHCNYPNLQAVDALAELVSIPKSVLEQLRAEGRRSDDLRRSQ